MGPLEDATKKRISRAVARSWEDDDVREKRVSGMTAAWADDAIRKPRIESLKKGWGEPGSDIRARRAAAIREGKRRAALNGGAKNGR